MAATAPDVLIETLQHWGVKVVFGLPGDGINGIMEALRTRQDRIRFVQVRPEEAAAFMAELRATVLSQDGRVVDTARDGIEALELLNQNRYDLIISDLRMPGLNGPALYEALRATPQTTPPEYGTFLRGTTEPVLEKPFSVDVVRQMVRVLLNER